MKWLALIAAMLVVMTANAHEVRPAFLKITEQSSVADTSAFEASFRQPQVDGRYLGLSVATNCAAENTGASVSEGALIEVMELRCGETGLTEIAIVGLDRTMIDALVSIIWLDGTTTNRLITAQAGSLDLREALPAVPVYLTIGISHLLLGYDHILFVLMLLYLVRRLVALLWVITSFTLAHSITLGLAAFDLVTLSPRPVEAVIAASIILLAYENLSPTGSLSHRFPVIIAFAFGLLHGLGFAGALQEIGLPEGSQVMALLLFNLGIELGQLFIVAVVLLALYAVRKIHFGRFLREAPVYLTGGIASFWFIERVVLL